MGETLPSLPDVVNEFRRTPADARTALLQHYIGKPTDSPAELQRRALLVSALNVERLWPPDAVA